MEKIKLIAVVGPTASGKTALAVRLAQHFEGEIVSGDSMQIYKKMPIAAAVPDSGERGGIPHHLMEFLDPQQSFTVADYVALAHRAIADICQRGRLPILVGGTGLYIDSLLQNITFCTQENNASLRAELLKEAAEKGTDTLYQRLCAIDSQTAARLHPNDQKRIIRALEVYALTGTTMSAQNAASRSLESPYAPCMIGLRFSDRQKLYDRINRRLDSMLENGLLEEARQGYARSAQCPTASAAIGHKEFFEYFSGEITLEQATENLKQATRRYAKRQMTWFGRNTDIRWIDADVVPDVFDAALEILKNF